MIDIQAAFEKFDDQYLKFDRVSSRFSERSDLHAFILLDKLVPGSASDIVSSAQHDEIFLGAQIDELEKVATEDDVLTLVRCGVRYDEQYDCLAMFV